MSAPPRTRTDRDDPPAGRDTGRTGHDQNAEDTQDAQDTENTQDTENAEEPMDDAPTQTTPPDDPERPPDWLRRRLITLAAVVLLIAIPAGYLVMSAFVSRDAGQLKAREATLKTLDWHWPSRVQQRIYDLDVPWGASHVAFYEENSWKTSSMHTQFHAGNQGLASFLKSIGAERSELKKGWTSGVSKEQADKVGWNFQKGQHRYWSLTHQRSKGTPELAITVDTASPKWPRVYVVSTVKFRGP